MPTAIEVIFFVQLPVFWWVVQYFEFQEIDATGRPVRKVCSDVEMRWI